VRVLLVFMASRHKPGGERGKKGIIPVAARGVSLAGLLCAAHEQPE